MSEEVVMAHHAGVPLPKLSGRRLSPFFVAIALLVLLPAAQAAANPSIKVDIVGFEGAGGSVTPPGGHWGDVVIQEFPGPIYCHLDEGLPEGSSPIGTCEREMDEVEPGVYAIELEAEAEPDSALIFWEASSGFPIIGCSGASALCLIASLGEDVEVGAYFSCIADCFAPDFYDLHVEIIGSGWVHSDPPEYLINCGTTCTTHGFEAGSVVTLAAAGADFVEWVECPGVIGGNGGRECEITMDADKFAVVEFDSRPEVTVAKAGGGNGWIHSEAPEYTINCGLPCTTQTAPFEEGVEASLIASGAEFAGWTSCQGIEAGRECQVTVSEDEEAVAEYTTKHALTAAKTGTGTGWVHSEAPDYAINCGGSCTSKTAFLDPGTVTLHASGAQFAGWASCPGAESGRDCEVSLDQDREAVAEFTAAYALTLVKTGSGNGAVTLFLPFFSFSCGTTCRSTTWFLGPSEVTFTASGGEFAEWVSCPGTVEARDCAFTLSADSEAVVRYGSLGPI